MQSSLTGSWLAASLFLGGVAAPALARAPAPPTNLIAVDHPWDDAQKIDLTWELSPDDAELVQIYQVLKAVATIGAAEVPPEFKLVEIVPAGQDSFTVGDLGRELKRWQVEQEFGEIEAVAAELAREDKTFRVGYAFQVIARGKDGSVSTPLQTTNPITPSMQWFDSKRVYFMMTVFIFCGAVVFFIEAGRRGRPLTIRKIAGLEAVDEAVGRATEMGRSVMFITGIQDMNDIQTIAGINILARVARTAAAYDAKIEVPTCRSLVMTTARETVHAAFMEAGRPDAYNEDLIYYVTDEQFGFVAYLQGMMVREKPAACFYMGSFFAESLILAETGNSIGAIQIAGTAQPAQLPFFVAACDYTLIGEEFFAASAYLTGSPEELGSLKGQDVGKLIVGAGIISGVLALTMANLVGTTSSFGAFLVDAVGFFKQVMLT
jgi:hypothetical protein